jgi:hypothetical protein
MRITANRSRGDVALLALLSSIGLSLGTAAPANATTRVRHWSDMLRFLAPGPIALGMQSCLDPAVWHATWGAIGAGRHAAEPQAGDEGTARRTQR